MSALKILVCGDVEGNFATLFKKIGTLHDKKGPFECLLCVGNFFGSNDSEWKLVLSGKLVAPLSTFVLGPTKRELVKFYPNDTSELAHNITYLGKQGVLTGSSGLKIVYLSGVEQNDSNVCSFSKNDVSKLINRLADINVDILLTPQWPHDVTKFAVPVDGINPTSTSRLISYLAKCIKPRYHFSGVSGLFYERLPYRNHQILQETAIQTTRFIGLAPVVNDIKLKWLYAFNIVPSHLLPPKELSNAGDGPVTECPYMFEENILEYSEKEESSQFFYAVGSSENTKRSRKENERSCQKKRQCPVMQEKCWFCFTNPDLEKQLLLSIGEYSYVTLAKGGIVDDHLLIIPMEHVPASVDLSEVAEQEINKYKNALVKYFDSCEKDVVFFERNFKSAHLQVQVVPIPKTKSLRIAENIKSFALSQDLELTEVSKYSILKQVVPPKTSYFYVEITIDKQNKGNLLHIIQSNFPLQFGRMMLASKSILNTPDRIDWKECVKSPKEDVQSAEKFRNSFESYDFTKL